METFTIEPQGPFSLQEAAQFGFGQRHATVFDGTMRLAFCIDGYQGHAGVSVTQSPDGAVQGTIWGTSGPAGTTGHRQGPSDAANVEAVKAQVARVLSLDHDARGYHALGESDPVIARLLDEAPGLRPPLFYSPYEAALWAVISQRRPRPSADGWRMRLSQAAGARFEVAGTEMWAVPTPEAILALGAEGVAAAAGIEAARAQRVVAVAEAAQAGMLDAATLAARSEDEARVALRRIPGIGPFYADLILIRATGVTDVLPLDEPRMQKLVGELYALGGPPSPKEVERLAEPWRPWRTWVAVLIRSAGSRLLAR